MEAVIERMSEDAKQELEAARQRLREKTAEASTYLHDNERLQVLFVACYCAVECVCWYS